MHVLHRQFYRGCTTLSSLGRLTWLDVSDTQASNEGLQCLAGCRAMEHLSLSYTHVTDDGLTVLTRLTALTHITLDSQLVTEQGVEWLARCVPWLVSLELFGTKVTDSSCMHLRYGISLMAINRTPCSHRALRQLRSLEICSGLLSDAGVAALHVLAPTLVRLSVAHNAKVSDRAIATSTGCSTCSTST